MQILYYFLNEVVMTDFKGRHFTGEVVLWAVCWYCCYGISYRDLESMLAERGVCVDQYGQGWLFFSGHSRTE